MALELSNSTATIKHINARKEGSGDDKELAVDLKLEVDEFAHCVLPYFDATLRGFLFNGPEVRYLMMDNLKWKGENENMQLDICGFVFNAVRASKFEIEPYIDGQGDDLDDYTDIQKVKVTFVASFKPQGREVATIAEMLGEQTQITLLPRQAELPV